MAALELEAANEMRNMARVGMYLAANRTHVPARLARKFGIQFDEAQAVLQRQYVELTKVIDAAFSEARGMDVDALAAASVQFEH